MIGFIRGKLVSKTPPQLVVDVQGVGYEVEAPMTTFYDLPALGEELKLFTIWLLEKMPIFCLLFRLSQTE